MTEKEKLMKYINEPILTELNNNNKLMVLRGKIYDR